MHRFKYTLLLFMLLVSSGLIGLTFMFVQPVNAIPNPGYLWISCGGDFIYRVNTTVPTGPADKSWDTGTSYPMGVEWYDGYVYYVDTDDYLYKMTEDGGSVTSWDLGSFSGAPHGLGCNGTHFGIADKIDDDVYFTTVGAPGTQVGSFVIDPDTEGFCWKDGYWYGVSSNLDRVAKYYAYGGQVTYYALHSDIGVATGITWDGTYWWISDDADDLVYKLTQSDLEGSTYTTSYDTPASDDQGLSYVYVPPVPPSTILVDPSSVATAEGFTVDINVTTVDDLYGYTFYMTWDDTLMNVADVEEGSFLESGGSTYFVRKVYTDYIYVTATLMAAAVGVDGSGTLATVYFTSSKANGECTLDLYDSILLNSFGEQITHAVVNGSFSNLGITLIPAATVSVAPSSVNTEEGFAVNVIVADVTELHRYEFSLGWDASLFDCAAVTEGPFLKLGGTTSFFSSINNPAGNILVKGHLSGATASQSGSGTLATVYFTSSKANGECDLDLYTTPTDFFLLDVVDNYWYHTVVDGSFSNLGITLIPAATVSVDPSLVNTEDPFSVDIKVSSATEVFMWEFNLYWDSSLIDCTGVTEGAFLSAGGTTDFYYNIEAWGNVLVNCTLQGGGTAQSGSGTLATISFSANKTSGECDLDLYASPTDFFLLDVVDNYWYHTVVDGYYIPTAAVPEFPLGAAMEIALASAIIYLWWKRRRKSSSYNLRNL